ncbi:hypothetical protein BMF94_0328 [Rhodotorula taiwanensis]|uniref:GDP-Man:Man(3)GlcNAc(2)-PP-dolichol alpha-1,2-mannosyltransferase n=1 Tax=Rhodotorula taiwanensis TaxID=741276 RepID=A0A2S5BIZ8_9BASI|nr:hypothetical protein BMF94_0328 [Rhodotorula taiwanensis]
MLPASPYVRYGVSAVMALVFLHVVGQLASPAYSHHTSLDQAKVRLGLKKSPASETWVDGRRVQPWESAPVRTPEDPDALAKAASRIPHGRESATFVMLARNSDVWGALDSIRQVEDRFNYAYHYDWLFLNEEPFNDEFKSHVSALCSGKVQFGLVPDEQWGKDMPSWIDRDKAINAINAMGQKPIPYGGSLPYRKMCRYQSGFFFEHPLLDSYEYYWRVEPNVKFLCDIPYDPFKVMKQHNRTYGFVVTLYEYQETIPTLWQTTKDFIDKNPQYLAEPNMMEWISPNKGDSYNGCHYWSNFEIAKVGFWRSEAYRAYFKHLDQAGGFFYERWGDAPVHSLAVSLFLRPDEIHFFNSIGYRHEPFQMCPIPAVGTKCTCSTSPDDPHNNFEFHGYSCTPAWKKITHYKSGTAFSADV